MNAKATRHWPDLPVAIKGGVSGRVGDKLFVGLGSSGPDLFCLDLADFAAGWIRCADFPGPMTGSAACATVGGRIYMFGGTGASHAGLATVFDTAYAYDVVEDSWSMLDTRTPCGMLGARASALSDGRIVIVGGYAKDVFDGFVAAMAAIDKERHPEQAEALRRSFLSMPPEQYRWNGAVLCYDPVANTWENLGEGPFLPVCDAAMVARGHDEFMLVNGEIKPGLRTPEAKLLTVDDSFPTWHLLRDLPAPMAGDIQEGVAGAFGGVAGGVVLIAGGANFKGSQANVQSGNWFSHDGLTKAWREEIYAFDGTAWTEVGTLPRGLGYGASFTLDEGVLIVGGEDGQGQPRNEVFLIRWDGAMVSVES